MAAPKPYHRASDYLTHALALEAESGGRVTSGSLGCLLEGWKKGGFRNNRLGINLVRRLLAVPAPDAAMAALHTGIANSPEPDIYRYFLAVTKADRGDFAAAEALLGECDPGKLDGFAGEYHYIYGEMLRRRGELTGAEREYRRALELVDEKSAGPVRAALSEVVSAGGGSKNGGTAGAPPRAPSAE